MQITRRNQSIASAGARVRGVGSGRGVSRSFRARRLGVVATGALLAVVMSGCATLPFAQSAPDAAAPSAAVEPSEAPTVDVVSKLLTIDDLPTGGWALQPTDSSEPETSTDKAETTVCQGNLASVLGTEEPPTVSFERARTVFSESLVPTDDSEALLETADAAVSACFGEQTERMVNGETILIEWEPVDVTGVDGAVKGYTLSASTGYVVTTSIQMYLVAGEGALVSVGVLAGSVTPDELAQLTQAAVDKVAE
ncbi:hypothetical protein ASF68_16270 [Plantibacter sp. Leaf314]|nr:hypothetical protein ASF68_16270 [Plantibacter sp. Leaf314]